MFIYVIESVAGVKVGITSNLQRRLASIRTGSPHKIHIAYSKEVGDEAYLIERKAHFLLAENRLSGEWFSCSVLEAADAIEVAIEDPIIKTSFSAQYLAIIHKDDGSDYGVYFPDFPGLITAGSNLDEALAMATEALALHLEGMEHDGTSLPQPTALEKGLLEAKQLDGVAVLVPVPLKDANRVRVNVTLPADVLSQIDAHAEREGFTRSGFLAQAAKKAMAA